MTRIYKLYELLFTTMLNVKLVNDYLASKKALWEELLQYHPVTTDLKETPRQKEEFHISLILHDLDTALESCKAQILAEEELLIVANISLA